MIIDDRLTWNDHRKIIIVTITAALRRVNFMQREDERKIYYA